jgi:hypothetical protein
MGEVGAKMHEIMGEKAKELWSMMYDEGEVDDKDCAYLREEIKKFYEEKENKETSKLKRIYNTAKKGIAKAGTVAYDYGMPVASGVAYYGWQALKLFGKAGFQIWNWITSNPKTAYFTLVMIKGFKTQLCRAGGEWFVARKIQIDDKESIIKWIKYVNPTLEISPDSEIADLKVLLRDLSKPFVNKVIMDGAKTMFKELGKNIGPMAAKALGASCYLIPYVGPLVAGSVETITGSVFSSMAEVGAEMAEQAAYQKNVENCFRMLREVVNPMSCVEEASKAAMNYIAAPTLLEELMEKEKVTDKKDLSPGALAALEAEEAALDLQARKERRKAEGFEDEEFKEAPPTDNAEEGVFARTRKRLSKLVRGDPETKKKKEKEKETEKEKEEKKTGGAPHAAEGWSLGFGVGYSKNNQNGSRKHHQRQQMQQRQRSTRASGG